MKHGLPVRVERPGAHVFYPHKVAGGRLAKQPLEQLNQINARLGPADDLALPLKLSGCGVEAVKKLADKAARVGCCLLFVMSCALFKRWVLRILSILSLGDWFLVRWPPGGEGY